MSTRDSILKKLLVTCCCSGTACSTAYFYNCWTAYEAHGLCLLNNQACCWILFAPVCHDFKIGDTNEAVSKCNLCFKYWLYSCALLCVSPVDACYNCICYNVDNWKNGVSGFGDVLQHTQWLGKSVEQCLELKTSNQPENTYKTFRP